MARIPLKDWERYVLSRGAITPVEFQFRNFQNIHASEYVQFVQVYDSDNILPFDQMIGTPFRGMYTINPVSPLITTV